jgi:hypothetical protein
MSDEMTPAVKTYEALIAKLEERNVIVARAVEFAQNYKFQNGILYLSFPEQVTDIYSRILMNSKNKPILDQAATEMRIQVVLE